MQKQNDLIPGVYEGAFNFGDYDGDGDNDLLLTGDTSSLIGSGKIAQMFQNDGQGNLIPVYVGNFEEVSMGVVEFVDVDGDCDLDLFVTGTTNDYLYKSKFYRNNNGQFELIENQFLLA